MAVRKVMDVPAVIPFRNPTDAAIDAGTLIGVGDVAGVVPVEIEGQGLGGIEPIGGVGMIIEVDKTVGEQFLFGDDVFYDADDGKAKRADTSGAFRIGSAVGKEGDVFANSSMNSAATVATTADTTVYVYTGSNPGALS